MNQIEHLRDRLRQRFPAASLGIDAPAHPAGHWWLDASLDGHAVVVEWRPGQGFGIATPARDDYGTGPDEVYEAPDTAFERICGLLLSRTQTRASEALSLH